VLALSALAGYLTAWLIPRVLNAGLTVGAPNLPYVACLVLELALALLILQLARRAARPRGLVVTRFEIASASWIWPAFRVPPLPRTGLRPKIALRASISLDARA